MSKNLKKILVTGASLLMLSSVGAGMSSVRTNAHAMSQAELAKIGNSKDPTAVADKWLAKYGGGAKAAKPMKMTPEERRENDARMAKNDAEADNDQIRWIEAGGHTRAQAKRILWHQEHIGSTVPSKSLHKHGKTVVKRHAHKRLHSHRSKRNQAHKATRVRRNHKAKRIHARKSYKANVRRAKKAHRTKRTKRVIRKHAKRGHKRSIKYQARLTVRQRRIINGAKSNYKITSHINAKELMDLEMDNPTTPRESKEFKALNQNEKYQKAAKKAFTPRQYKRIAYLFK